MGLLQNIIGQISGGQSTDEQGHGLLEAVAGLLNHPQVGGIGGLSQLFQNQGLGHLVSGWISRGPNPPVTGDQLQGVLGSERIAEIARKLGIDQSQAATRLAAVLPQAVDHLTPDGQIPPGGGMRERTTFWERSSPSSWVGERGAHPRCRGERVINSLSPMGRKPARRPVFGVSRVVARPTPERTARREA